MEMTLLASELNTVTWAEAANWSALNKNVQYISPAPGIVNWNQPSLGPFGQNNAVSRSIVNITPHNRLVYNLDVFYGYVTTPLVTTDNLKISVDGTVSNDMTLTAFDAELTWNEQTAWANLTHTVNTLQVNAQCDWKVTQSDQFFFIRKFAAWIVPCHFSCAYCLTSDKNTCSSCPAFATQNGNICTCDSSHFMLNNVCITSCPAGYSSDTVNRVCLLNVQNCATPLNITACSTCNGGYYLNTIDLLCYTSCPQGLEMVISPQSQCQTYDKVLSQTTGSMLFSLFDRPWSSNSEFGLKGVAVTQCTGCTQPTSRLFNWCGNDKIAGGYGRMTSFTMTKSISAGYHCRYRFYVQLYLIDNWAGGGSVTITVDNDIYTYTSADCPSSSQLCGSTAYNDCIIVVDITALHQTTSFTLTMTTFTLPNISTVQSFGFNNMYLSVDKCVPNCIQCAYVTSNICSKCASGYYLNAADNLCYNPCPAGFYGTTPAGSVSVCLPCSVQCSTCVTTAINCTACAANRLGIPTCNCPDGTYSLNGLNAYCDPCSYQCTKCTNTSTNCTACAAKRDSTTIPNCTCQVNTYNVVGTPACQDCFNVCSACTGPTQPECTACKSATRDPLNACACANHYYGDFTTLDCNVCDTTCYQCATTSTNCTSCPSGAAPAGSVARGLVGSTCVCPNGSYDSAAAYCPTCNYKCATCTGATSTPTDCQVCQPGRSLATNCGCLSGFDIPNNPTCAACPIQCLTCDSSGNCLTCNGTNNTRLTTPTCLCKPGYYENYTADCLACAPQCATCTNGTTCASCLAGRDPPNCACSYGTYSDANNVCQPCNQNCDSCYGPYSYQCIQCAPNRVTPPNCTCPQGTFNLTGQVLCPKCHTSCLTCNGANSNNCLSCDPSNRILQGTSCVCQDGYFNNAYGQCQQCSSFCAKCTDASTCTVCQGNRQGNSCTCPLGYYDTSAATCPACDARCAQCSGTSVNCTVCATNRTGEPSCLCSSGFYEIPNTKTCSQCQWQCLTCSANSDACLTCRGNRMAIQATNDCICPDYTYEDFLSQNCPSCYRSCKRCSGGLSSNCTLCKDTYLRDSSNNCLCPTNTYEDTVNAVCVTCDVSCSQCVGATSSQCTACSTNYTSVKGVCVLKNTSTNVCSSLCSSCDSSYNCLTCLDSQREVINGKCMCMGGTYDNGISCLSCDSTCQTCNGSSSSSCTSCRSGFVLSSGFCKSDVTEQNTQNVMLGLSIAFGVLGGLLLIYVIYRVVQYYMAKSAATQYAEYGDNSRPVEDMSQYEINSRENGPFRQQNNDNNQGQHHNPQQMQNEYMRYSYL